ncbi:site-2 protease family protein [Candidatus Gracilibacteria bacterium]|nr:site-2 protease family protein [Candidatus Gracilibacteria bacterium]
MFSIIAGIILALVIFSVIVFFHELGHYFFSKIFGVKIEEFGIGMPPRILRLYKDKSGTEYTLNLLPIGGFVKLKGEEFNKNTIKDKNSLVGRPLWQQMIIALAGIFMNFLFAAFIISIAFNVGVQPISINTQFNTITKTKLIPSLDDAVNLGILKIDGIMLSPVSGSVAEKAGIKEGDILYKIDDKEIKNPEEMIKIISSSKKSVNLKIKRKGKILDISLTPIDGKIGSYVGYNVTELKKDFVYKYGFFDSFKEGVKETYNQSVFTLELLKGFVNRIVSPIKKEREEATKSLGGPIAIGNLFVNLVNQKVAISIIFLIGAIISINLGVFNLLPIPALDGGRFFIMLINGIVIFLFGKKVINEKIESTIHVVGFSLLIVLSVFVAYQDIWRIFTG